jgi:hypothetical protein
MKNSYVETTCDLCGGVITEDNGGGIHKGNIIFKHEHHMANGGRTDNKQFDICDKCLPKVLEALPLSKGQDIDN